ncbi:MAG: hypothetical protein NTW86_06490, partial [Candidatus Sumerlaeota bacterium]|nr:hypothetical protein [Candidatus Sumerlaeota bacterium]
RPCLRLLLLAISANATALASYAPVSLFFTATSFEKDYHFLVLMHVAVFALAGALSLAVIAATFRATAAALGRPLRRMVLWAWAVLYGVVGMQMAWTLRPWIGDRHIAYTFLRPIEGSFFESVWKMIHH